MNTTFSTLLGASIRTLRWQTSAVCQSCSKRMASKARSKRGPSMEIELTSAVPRLGNVGDRVLVAPGMMRNHLYPKRMALYVLQGRTLSIDGSLSNKRDSASSSSTLLPSAPRPSLLLPPQARLHLDEGKIAEQLSMLEPLRYTRRTTGHDILHGSVTMQDILATLQERGIQVQELEGAFQGKDGDDGIENGRIKKTGEYIFTAKLQHSQQPIVVHVLREE